MPSARILHRNDSQKRNPPRKTRSFCLPSRDKMAHSTSFRVKAWEKSQPNARVYPGAVLSNR
jgi:hypothetical protein